MLLDVTKDDEYKQKAMLAALIAMDALNSGQLGPVEKGGMDNATQLMSKLLDQPLGELDKMATEVKQNGPGSSALLTPVREQIVQIRGAPPPQTEGSAKEVPQGTSGSLIETPKLKKTEKKLPNLKQKATEDAKNILQATFGTPVQPKQGVGVPPPAPISTPVQVGGGGQSSGQVKKVFATPTGAQSVQISPTDRAFSVGGGQLVKVPGTQFQFQFRTPEQTRNPRGAQVNPQVGVVGGGSAGVSGTGGQTGGAWQKKPLPPGQKIKDWKKR